MKISEYYDLPDFEPNNLSEAKVKVKIRISNHKLMIETGRYNQTSRNDRFCPICNSGIIEDEFHFLFHCPKYSIPREKFYNQIQHNFVDFNQLSYTELIIKLMNSLASHANVLWGSSRVPTPRTTFVGEE